jgi:two-component system, chemotaxis family, chemotaxis protein CheY
MKILIVDDSRTMRMIVVRTLRQAGFEGLEIQEAGNGVEALAALREGGIEVVLSDWNMPEMNGLELLKNVKSEGLEVQFGFVTSESTPEMEKIAVDNGALFLIGKPFTPETFQRVLSPVIS